MEFETLNKKFISSQYYSLSSFKHQILKPILNLFDGLLYTNHGVPPAVEEDVGHGVRGGLCHKLLSSWLYDAVITMQPACIT